MCQCDTDAHAVVLLLVIYCLMYFPLPVGCLITVNVLWPCLAVPWVGLQCVIVVFPDYTHLRVSCTARDRTCGQG